MQTEQRCSRIGPLSGLRCRLEAGHKGDHENDPAQVQALTDALVDSTFPQCHAASDGDCIWKECPQLRDGEPQKSGRHCPLDNREEE